MTQVAYKCNVCGELVEIPNLHKCKTTFEEVSLGSAEYCAKFNHRWKTVREVPNSRVRFGRIERIWENEDKYIEYDRFKVIRQCSVCGLSQTFDEDQRLTEYF